MQPHPLMLNSISRTHTWPLNQPIFSFLFATHWMGWLAKLRPNWLLGKFQIDFMIWFFNQLWNDFAKKLVKNHFLVEVRNRNFVFFVAFKNGFRFHGQHWKTVFDVEKKSWRSLFLPIVCWIIYWIKVIYSQCLLYSF